MVPPWPASQASARRSILPSARNRLRPPRITHPGAADGARGERQSRGPDRGRRPGCSRSPAHLHPMLKGDRCIDRTMPPALQLRCASGPGGRETVGDGGRHGRRLRDAERHEPGRVAGLCHPHASGYRPSSIRRWEPSGRRRSSRAASRARSRSRIFLSASRPSRRRATGTSCPPRTRVRPSRCWRCSSGNCSSSRQWRRSSTLGVQRDGGRPNGLGARQVRRRRDTVRHRTDPSPGWDEVHDVQGCHSASCVRLREGAGRR